MDPKFPMRNTTLCYLEQDNAYLMLHRVTKKNDLNHDKWIGVGGKFEPFESPEDCLLREVQEETGLILTSYRCRGVVTFLLGELTEYMFLYTADAWTGTLVRMPPGTRAFWNGCPKSRWSSCPSGRATRSSSACSRRTDPFSRSNSDMKMIRWLKPCWTGNLYNSLSHGFAVPAPSMREPFSLPH